MSLLNCTNGEWYWGNSPGFATRDEAIAYGKAKQQEVLIAEIAELDRRRNQLIAQITQLQQRLEQRKDKP